MLLVYYTTHRPALNDSIAAYLFSRCYAEYAEYMEYIEYKKYNVVQANHGIRRIREADLGSEQHGAQD